MEIYTNYQSNPPVNRGYVVSMIINEFKGYQDVEVHLFKPSWTSQEEKSFDWDNLLGNPIKPDIADESSSRRVLMETFDSMEKDILIEYIKERYASRVKSLTAGVMQFPIPKGLTPLSDFSESENIGIIRFENIPNYPLEFSVHGIYDLSRHMSVSY